MSELRTLPCPYCGNPVQFQVNERTVTDTAAVTAATQVVNATLQREVATKGLVQSHDPLQCRVCLYEYELIPNITDFTFFKSHLKPLKPMLEEFKKHFPNETLDSIFGNVTGITRPKMLLSDRVLHHSPHLHICFILNGKRAVLDCEQEVPSGRGHKPVLRGLGIEV